jgi:predicted  nucleic acid-binding Zn-ribbon protein
LHNVIKKLERELQYEKEQMEEARLKIEQLEERIEVCKDFIKQKEKMIQQYEEALEILKKETAEAVHKK